MTTSPKFKVGDTVKVIDVGLVRPLFAKIKKVKYGPFFGSDDGPTRWHYDLDVSEYLSLTCWDVSENELMETTAIDMADTLKEMIEI